MNYSSSLLQGRRYLVTGVTGGAGRATAILISQLGGSVTCIAPDPERTEKVRRELHGGGHDVTISGLYNGIFHASGKELIMPAGMVSDESVAEIFDASIGGAIGLIKSVAARNSILKDGGSVVMMSSVAAVCGTSGMTIYAASKGAIEGLVRSAAIELATRRIRVNAIRAGGFQSPMHSRIAARATPDSLDDYAAKHPLGFGKSEDVANMAVYLLSDMGRWITGSMVVVDGGFSCR